jgi:cyclophilin family peptidyl-prolyl cis-trans isomerase
MRGALIGMVLLALAATGCGGENSNTSGSGDCENVESAAPRDPETLKPPAQNLDPSRTYSLTFDTSCGSFVVRLDTKLAPKTAASLVKLTRGGYFDDTIFHRIVPDFIIQGGDPTQTGAGGPGYSVVDKPPADARYSKGTLAMAKTPAETAGTSGSQFFVVTAGDAGLPPDYAIAGKVTDGLEVVDRIGKLGDATEHPTQPVVIRTVRVAESP